MRTSRIDRKTKETDIGLFLELDGSGSSQINTGVGFFDHMLTLFAAHGLFDLTVECKGDLQVDSHHTAEDVGICLGKAFAEAVGDKKGITRYGSIVLPMDESLVLVAADYSGRGFLAYDLPLRASRVGCFDTELVEEFFAAFVREAGITLHIKKISGKNTHHIIEACFKAFGRVMDSITAIDSRRADALPSTKGVL